MKAYSHLNQEPIHEAKQTNTEKSVSICKCCISQCCCKTNSPKKISVATKHTSTSRSRYTSVAERPACVFPSCTQVPQQPCGMASQGEARGLAWKQNCIRLCSWVAYITFHGQGKPCGHGQRAWGGWLLLLQEQEVTRNGRTRDPLTWRRMSYCEDSPPRPQTLTFYTSAGKIHSRLLGRHPKCFNQSPCQPASS